MSRPFSQPDVFAAIADPTRRAILSALADGDKAVGELAEPFGISLPAVSQHLKILRETGLVDQTQVGRRRVYSIKAESLRQVAEWVGQYERFWKSKLKSLGRYLKEDNQ